MGPPNDTPEAIAAELLDQRPPEAYLDSGESLRHVLTNTRVGVRRIADGTVAVEPGPELGAVAGLTNRRILFAVGDPDDCEGDYAASVPYVSVDAVETRTETLTRTLVVETAPGLTWEFTAREVGDFDAVASFLEARAAGEALDDAREHRSRADDAAERTERIDALESALTAYERTGAFVDVEADALGERGRAAREAARAVVDDLIEAHLARARERRSAGNWSWGADDEDAYRRFSDARGAFRRALELAEAHGPGDADAIEEEYEDLEDRLESLEIRVAVANATD